MASFENTIVRIVDWLNANPAGGASTEIAAALGLTYGHVSGSLWQATQQKRIAWRPAPKGKASNRRHYFALRHVPAVFKANKPKPRSVTKMDAAAAPTTPSGVKFTRYEAPAVAEKPVTPTFSALRLGSYYPNDTAIARAYGGAR